MKRLLSGIVAILGVLIARDRGCRHGSLHALGDLDAP